MLNIQNNYNYHSYILPNSNRTKSPSFCSNQIMVRDFFTGVNTTPYATCFFRGDLNWNQFCKLILNTFKKGEKINILCIGCSDGSEPISLLLKLAQTKRFKENPEFFGEIKAYDKDEEMLKVAMSNKIPMINKNEIRFDDRLALSKNAKRGEGILYNIKNDCLELTDKIKNRIHYEKKGIIEVIESIPKYRKVVLMARNIWPYLNGSELIRTKIALTRLKEGSILVIGDFDKEKILNFEQEIIKLGFKKAKTKNCYIKISDKSFFHTFKQRLYNF